MNRPPAPRRTSSLSSSSSCCSFPDDSGADNQNSEAAAAAVAASSTQSDTSSCVTSSYGNSARRGIRRTCSSSSSSSSTSSDGCGNVSVEQHLDRQEQPSDSPRQQTQDVMVAGYRNRDSDDEDAIAFGRRLKFIQVEDCGGRTVPWPCLVFESFQQMTTVLDRKDMLSEQDICQLRQDYIQHKESDNISTEYPDSSVAFLLGQQYRPSRLLSVWLLRRQLPVRLMDYEPNIWGIVNTLTDYAGFQDAFYWSMTIMQDSVALQEIRMLPIEPSHHAPCA